MTTARLSERAQMVLLVVQQQTERDWSTGRVLGYFRPTTEPINIGLAEPVTVEVAHGTHDARLLQNLDHKRLIERPRAAPDEVAYAYVITEDGVLEAERIRAAWGMYG